MTPAQLEAARVRFGLRESCRYEECFSVPNGARIWRESQCLLACMDDHPGIYIRALRGGLWDRGLGVLS